jgi:L-alanine-DL-glutamate epimerase-like enolase superfamily enzyme
MPRLSLRQETWPLAGSFTISRGTRTTAETLVVELTHQGDDGPGDDPGDGGGAAMGRGECVPYARYGETMDGVMAAIEGLRARIEDGLDRIGLQALLPPGAARNALDCAYWDLEAKRAGQAVWRLCGLAPLEPVITAYTLSLDTPEIMGRAAAVNAARPLLKLKLAGPDDLARVEAVRAKAPETRLIVDANEGWTLDDYVALAPRLAALGVVLIEQPLPAGQDAALAGVPRPVPVCADESCHATDSLAPLAGRYDAVNIKLDKTGGLTEALELKQAALDQGYQIMVGCMLATSLAMAPAVLVAQGAAFVDLDGPLLLEADRPGGLRFEGSTLHPPAPALWG